MTVIDPEPCDTCDLGIAKMVCYDGFRRCVNCIEELIKERGWDEAPQEGFGRGVGGGNGRPSVAGVGEGVHETDDDVYTDWDRVDDGPSSSDDAVIDNDIPEHVLAAEAAARQETSGGSPSLF